MSQIFASSRDFDVLPVSTQYGKCLETGDKYGKRNVKIQIYMFWQMLKDKYKESLQFSTESWCGQKCSWWWLSPPGPSMTGSTATSFTGTPSLLSSLPSPTQAPLTLEEEERAAMLQRRSNFMADLRDGSLDGQNITTAAKSANIFITWDPY